MSGRLLLKREGVPRRRNNRRLKESIERLQKTVVRFNFLDTAIGEVWQSAQLLGTCEIITRSGELQYSYPRGLPEKLIEPALYSYLSLKVIYQFQSKYALILYETLKRFADRDAAEPYWPVKTSQLRDLLGCRDKLANWQLFRRRALDPAVAEINELSGFVVELMEIRQGSGVAAVRSSQPSSISGARAPRRLKLRPGKSKSHACSGAANGKSNRLMT